MIAFRYQLSLVTPPTVEPISLTLARDHMRLDEDTTEDDPLIKSAITAARILAETQLRRALITQTWLIALDSFPGSWAPEAYRSNRSCDPAFTIPLSPVQSVMSVKYYDSAGALVTLDPTAYEWDAFGAITRLRPVFGTMWPVTAQRLGAVQVQVRCGYGDTADTIPLNIRQWMLCAVTEMYEHRIVTTERGALAMNPFIDGLLDPHRMVL